MACDFWGGGEMQFKSPSVTFMGHKLTDRGVEPNPAKVAAITETPAPTGKSGVQRFLGMCQYLSKFCHNLSETVLPLRDLTREDYAFLLSNKHENAFNSAKKLIASATALRYNDAALHAMLQVDASEDAIGGVLLQNDQPVCFTSHTLNSTEKTYAQIEKERLAIVSCMDRWHQYPYGTHDITVHTDHQLLETIFKKPLSKAPADCKEWCWSCKDISSVSDRGKERNFTLRTLKSRAAVTGQPSSTAKQECEVFRLEIAEMDPEPNRVTPDTLKRIRRETAKDPVLAPLNAVIMNGWPSERKETPEPLRLYWNFRDEISVYDGVLYRSHQVFVPAVLRNKRSQKIRKAHQGPDSMRVSVLARNASSNPGEMLIMRTLCLVPKRATARTNEISWYTH